MQRHAADDENEVQTKVPLDSAASHFEKQNPFVTEDLLDTKQLRVRLLPELTGLRKIILSNL